MRSIAAASVAATPWRNGGGRTRELLVWPSAQDWRLRLSLADIEHDGPFSAFPGITRWFAVLEGAGVELKIDERWQRVRADDAPLCFDGAAAPVCCLIDGPTRDLNLMLRGCRGRLVPITPAPQALPRDEPVVGLFTAVAGRVGDVAVAAQTLVWFGLDTPPPVPQFQAAAGASQGARTGWWICADLLTP